MAKRRQPWAQVSPRAKKLGWGKGLAVVALGGLTLLGPEAALMTVPAIAAILSGKK